MTYILQSALTKEKSNQGLWNASCWTSFLYHLTTHQAVPDEQMQWFSWKTWLNHRPGNWDLGEQHDVSFVLKIIRDF